MKLFSRPLSVFSNITVSLAVVWLSPVAALSQAGTSLQVGIAPPTSANESNRTAFLTWTAAAGSHYRVRCSTNLSGPAAWTTEDVVSQTTNGPLKWMAPEALGVQKYYQLILPQPEIFSVEPAVIAPGVTVDFYVQGQGFQSNDVLRINGVDQAEAVFVSPNLLRRAAFTPGGSATYTVQLIRAGQVLSAFDVTCADAASAPELVLQGPPTEPLASPCFQKGAQGTRDLAQSAFKIALKLGQPARDPGPKDDDCGGGSERKVNAHAGEQCDNGLGSSADSLFSGQVSQQVVDLAVPARSNMHYLWGRTYNSRIGRTGTSVNGWTFSYDVSIQAVGSNIAVRNGTGRADTFKPDTNGVYTCAEFFSEGTLSNNVFKLTFADTGYWEFNPLTAASNSGKLSKIVDRSGNIMLLNYDTLGRLTQVVDDLARTNLFGYNSDGQLASVTDCFGRTVTYQYYQGLPSDRGGKGDLKSVTSPPVTGTPNGNDFPAGKTVTYTYTHGYPVALDRQNHLLLSCVDALGVVSEQYTYDLNSTSPSYLRCVSMQHWTNTPTMISYLPQAAAPSNQFATLRCIVNDPVGNVTECFFDARGRGLRLEEFTGRATPVVPVTDVSNRPTGQLRSSDPVSFVSLWSWNNDSLCTSEILPSSEQRQYVYESDFDKRTHARKRADCRVVREIASSPVDLDGDGVADLAERVWRFEYDPRFGSDPGESRLRSGVIAEVGAGRPATVGRARGIITTKPTSGSTGSSAAVVVRHARRLAFEPDPGLAAKGIITVKPGSTGIADGVTFGREKLKATTHTQGDFNLSNRRKGWDGTIKGLVVPDGNSMAIKTKGTGADNNRIRNKGWNGTIKGLVVPDGNSMAIKTKGTGADNNRGTAADQWPNNADLDFNDQSVAYNFATSITDPRGNVTTGTYDANGNRVKVQFHWDRQSSAERDFAYDTHGQLAAVTNAPDANGYRSVDTFSYYSSGPQAGCLQSSVEDAGGLALTESYEYDARGNLTRCIDPRGNDTLYTYNSLDQLMQASSAPLSNGGTGTFRIRMQYTYDANDNLTLVAEENLDATGTPGTNPFWRTQFVYDGGQRLSGICRDKNAALTQLCNEVQYNAADQVVLYRSPEAVNGDDASNTVALAYDERGMLFREISAPGSSGQSSSQCDYDANGNLTRLSEGLEETPSVTTMEYDGFAGFDPVFPPFAATAFSNPLYDIRTKRSASSAIAGTPIVTVPNPLYDLRIKFSASSVIKGTPLVALANPLYDIRSKRSASFAIVARSKQSEVKANVKKAYTSDRISKITDPMGNVTTFNYDASDNLKVVRHFGETNDVPGTNGNIRLAESHFEYDGLDRLVRSRDSFFSLPTQSPIGDGERNTTFAYAPNSECTSVTDDLSHETTCAYDTACRLSSVSSAGARTVYARFFDTAGNVTRATQTDALGLGGAPQVFSRTNIYDALNRCVSTVDNVGNTTAFAYDSRDNCVSVIDPNGNQKVYGYDGLSRMVSFTCLQGAASTGIVMTSGQLAYDDNDNCTSSADANGNVTQHAYDSLGRCTQTTQADGTHNSLVWSPRSNLTQETDANGTVITHTYDANDRLVASHITPVTGVASTTLNETFGYDGCSRLVTAANEGSTCTFTYDSLDNCVSETRNNLATTSIYDSLGNRLSLMYPGGRTLAYAYDLLDQCTNIVEAGSSLVNFRYAGNRVMRINYGNGTRTDITYDGLEGVPNASGDHGFGQISRVVHTKDAGATVVEDRTFGYDPAQNKTARNMTSPFTVGGVAQAMYFQYDAVDRLVTSLVTTNGGVARFTTYGLDRMGNRTNVTGATTCSGNYSMSSAMAVADAQMNQYTTTPCDTRTYDNNGNLASRDSSAGPMTYQYDYAGRLVEVQALDFNTGSLAPQADYAYDALGRRISKTIQGVPVAQATTEFFYDGGDVLEERVSGVRTADYESCPVRFNQGSYGLAWGKLQMRRGGRDYFFHPDDQGNVLALTTTGGSVAERYDYDDNGAMTFLTGDGVSTTAKSSAVGNPYCSQGLRLDPETELQNNDGGGYFETRSGRPLSSDSEKREFWPLL